MRDLLSDLNNYAWPAIRWYASETVNDVSASCGISLNSNMILWDVLILPVSQLQTQEWRDKLGHT